MATHSSVLAWRIPEMGGAWWAALYGIAQSRTRLKQVRSSSSSSSNSIFVVSFEVKEHDTSSFFFSPGSYLVR